VKLLLDTCTFLWILMDAPELSGLARERFRNPDNEVFLSSVSAWEIALKHSLGSLPLPDRPERLVPEAREKHGIEALPLEEAAALHVARLPGLHRDPFDRMLVCQGIVHGLVVLTPDPLIAQYPVPTAW
jgi:PIN domain nuclease of toxin-antitoxin system